VRVTGAGGCVKVAVAGGVDVLVGRRGLVGVEVVVGEGSAVNVGGDVAEGNGVRVGRGVIVSVDAAANVAATVGVAKWANCKSGVLSCVNPMTPSAAAKAANKKGLRSARRCLPRVRCKDTAEILAQMRGRLKSRQRAECVAFLGRGAQRKAMFTKSEPNLYQI